MQRLDVVDPGLEMTSRGRTWVQSEASSKVLNNRFGMLLFQGFARRSTDEVIMVIRYRHVEENKGKKKVVHGRNEPAST